MNGLHRPHHKSRAYSSAFSMIEVMIVVGIVLVLTGAGTVGFLSTLKGNRMGSAMSMVQSQMQQARQNAIAMRQDRRVAINFGTLEDQENLSGQRVQRPSVWIEGKRCERFPFSGSALCQGGDGPNAYQISDETFLPDGVTVTLATNQVSNLPGRNANPTLIYFQFNPRGQLAKVYYDGQEPSGEFNYNLPGVLHFFADNTQFQAAGQTMNYVDLVQRGQGDSACFEFGGPNSDDGPCALQRYTVRTLEVVRLTGKTRQYDYGYQDPFPFDQPNLATR